MAVHYKECMGRRPLYLLPLLLLALVVGSCQPFSGHKHIGILMWSEELVGYRQAHKGLIDGLHANGYREGFNIEIDDRTAGGEDAKAREILSEFVRRRYDLVVTIGSAACLVAKEVLAGSGIPVMLISGNALKYGALLAVSPDFYNVGRQTVPHLVKVLGGMAARDVASEGPYDYQFAVNRATARDLGVPLSWNVFIDADAIVE